MSIYRCRHEFPMSNIDNTLRLVTSAVVEQSLICQMCYLKGWDSLRCRYIALVNALGALLIKNAICNFWRKFKGLFCHMTSKKGMGMLNWLLDAWVNPTNFRWALQDWFPYPDKYWKKAHWKDFFKRTVWIGAYMCRGNYDHCTLSKTQRFEFSINKDWAGNKLRKLLSPYFVPASFLQCVLVIFSFNRQSFILKCLWETRYIGETPQSDLSE